MIRSFLLIGLLSFNLSAENNEKALKQSLLKFWEARNAQDFETIFFYESKIGAITGSSSENYFYEDPPPNFDSVIDYYSRVESNVTPSNIRIIQLSEKVYLTLYYLAGSYKYSNGRVDDEYQARVSNIWLYEDGGFKLYYKNFNKLKKELKPMDIIAYPMD
ncbi:MAG: hypothetical protein ACJ0FP_01735 [Gammaproteobacteria bacterium]|uniref:Nuclear transport factor 2 family protein n=1 Tax=SAR86 cluster bacterium TaxID=2030880 RepID=A0A368BQ74_9GAMM|nr:hypothetical protein [Gammaproteobacteria bacterium]RCL39440.1 MAG: hypothetical protein DBW98_00925 [SAR86 cluster bacterium]|tara:strand:- start:5140 stop:5622 length:483 start_codon:yes stop_codon:yes gene_type:complete